MDTCNSKNKQSILIVYCAYILMLALFLSGNLYPVSASSFDVEIEVEPPGVEAFQEAEFSAVVKVGVAKSFLWEFGDGGKCTEQTCVHVYKKGGITYTVKLTVVSDTGISVTKTLILDVQKAKGG